jgi:alpha-D-ribose 1-methylphosphonate 5-triphosphate synthase subunit PhnG
MIERNALAACLSAAGRDEVLALAQRVTEGLTVSPLQPPESGLALMQWRDAVQHQLFFLGEVPLARAAVMVLDTVGQRAEGGAVVMADDVELAQALAALDAVHSHRLPGAEAVDALAECGARARARTRAERQAVLKRTRVDFALLSDGGEDER